MCAEWTTACWREKVKLGVPKARYGCDRIQNTPKTMVNALSNHSGRAVHTSTGRASELTSIVGLRAHRFAIDRGDGTITFYGPAGVLAQTLWTVRRSNWRTPLSYGVRGKPD